MLQEDGIQPLDYCREYLEVRQLRSNRLIIIQFILILVLMVYPVLQWSILLLQVLMLTLLPMLTLMYQVHKLILQLIRQEIPEGEALEVQEPEEVLEEVLEAQALEVLEEVLEAAVLPEEEVQPLETLEEEVRQVQALKVPEGVELEVPEQAEVLK